MRCAIVTVLLALAPSSAAATPRLFVIQGDAKLGPYAIRADGTLAGAIEAFGAPSSIRRGRRYDRTSCSLEWRGLGLRISFSHFGGQNPCRSGFFSQALVTGALWRTAKGLRIGDSYHRMATLYRRQFATPWAWLVKRYSPIATVHYGLQAKTVNDRVVAFRVSYAAGGD